MKSFLEISFLISPNELKVAVWEILVDIPAATSLITNVIKILMQSGVYKFMSLTPLIKFTMIFAMYIYEKSPATTPIIANKIDIKYEPFLLFTYSFTKFTLKPPLVIFLNSLLYFFYFRGHSIKLSNHHCYSS